MKVRVVYNEHTKKYRIAYTVGRIITRWKYAKRIVISAQVSDVGMAKYVESMQEVAEFDVIGEAQEYIEKYVAPKSDWYDPRDDHWVVEAEVDIPGVREYKTPSIDTQHQEQ